MRDKIILILMMCTGFVKAQDAHISQFYTNAMAINPAQTGMYEGDYKIFLQHRNQWRAVLNEPFSTQVLAFDKPQKKYGYGALISNTRAGIAAINDLNALASGAYEITIDPSGIHNLTTGIQLGVLYRSVNVNELTFDNQYTTDNGGGFDKNISHGEMFTKTSITRLQTSAGVYYFHNDVNKKYKPYFGIAGFNLNMPKESFMGETKRRPMRFLLNGGVRYDYNEEVSFHPMFIYQRQAKVNEFNVGTLVYYFLKEQNVKTYGGLFWRTKDAIGIHIGAIYKDYTVGFNYDINTSSLRNVSRGRGAFEISLIYSKQSYKYVPSF